MSEKMTRITLPGSPRSGWMDWGEHSASDMISQIRAYAKDHLEEAQAVLAATDEEFEVDIVRGPIVQDLVKIVQRSSRRP